MLKRGKVKFADHVKGYGYILSEDASDPKETVFFEIDDVSSSVDGVVAGSDVIFEVDQESTAAQARNVQSA